MGTTSLAALSLRRLCSQTRDLSVLHKHCSASVLIYPKKMNVKTLIDESSVHIPAMASALTMMATWQAEDISYGKLRALVNSADALI